MLGYSYTTQYNTYNCKLLNVNNTDLSLRNDLAVIGQVSFNIIQFLKLPTFCLKFHA